jgi:hypothetical protein
VLCSCSHHKKFTDRVTLASGESKDYSFETNEPMVIGMSLNHDVTGGTVELRQTCSVESGHWSQRIATGSGGAWASQPWQPCDGKVELKLMNNASSSVEVTVFSGDKPN